MRSSRPACDTIVLVAKRAHAPASVLLPTAFVVHVALAMFAGCSNDGPHLDDDPIGFLDPGGSDPSIDPALLEVTPDTIDVGPVGCGSSKAAAVPIRITNKGTVLATYEVSLAEGTAFALDGTLKGDLAPGGEAVVPVSVKPTALGASSAVVSVRVGPISKIIAIEAQGMGPALAIAPSIADFGEVRAKSGGTLDVELKNTGTEKLVVRSFSGGGGGLSISLGSPSDAGLTVFPGSTSKVTLSLAPGAAGSTPQATFTPVIEDTICGTVPSVTAKAALVNRDVLFTVADFDKQGCGATPTVTKDIVVTNYSSSALAINAATPGSGSVFSIPQPSVTVPKAASESTPGTGKLTVALKTLPTTLAEVSETVNLSVTGTPALAPPDGGERTTKARVDVRGVVIAYSPSSLSFETNCYFSNRYGRWVCQQSSKNFSVSNTGNETATLAWDYERTTGFPSWRYNPPGSIGANGNASGKIEYAPQDPGESTAKLTPRVTSQWPSCSPPPVLTFTGSTH
jgi:hypothetical protein